MRCSQDIFFRIFLFWFTSLLNCFSKIFIATFFMVVFTVRILAAEHEQSVSTITTSKYRLQYCRMIVTVSSDWSFHRVSPHNFGIRSHIIPFFPYLTHSGFSHKKGSSDKYTHLHFGQTQTSPNVDSIFSPQI